MAHREQLEVARLRPARQHERVRVLQAARVHALARRARAPHAPLAGPSAPGAAVRARGVPLKSVPCLHIAASSEVRTMQLDPPSLTLVNEGFSLSNFDLHPCSSPLQPAPCGRWQRGATTLWRNHARRSSTHGSGPRTSMTGKAPGSAWPCSTCTWLSDTGPPRYSACCRKEPAPAGRPRSAWCPRAHERTTAQHGARPRDAEGAAAGAHHPVFHLTRASP
jgi:hypothetical protein